MNQELLNLLPQEKNDATARFAAYGDLRRVEAWRWTPLAALNAPRKVAHADYQLDLPDAVDEGLQEDAAVRARWLQLSDAPFAWANFALLGEALTLTIPKDAAPQEPLALNIDAARRALQCSRIHVVVEEGAKAAFWFDFRSSSQAAQWPVITLDVADNAELQGVLWFGGEEDTAQLAHVFCTLGTHSRARLNAVQHGGALARLDLEAHLVGEHGDFSFGGLQTLEAAQVADCHVVVRHLTENGVSHQVLRGALDAQSKGIFDGLIYVAHGAQLTDAQQDSRYMLMSNEAMSHSVPRLEIYADDVKCAHGSTVGFLDPEALFYLRSRGISEDAARKMLTLSFLHEAVVVDHDALHDALHDAISALWMKESGDDDQPVA
ncbi:MAG: Fe-S cluster assembly protein SufD [Cardiobacteriaceae bacterium]|nr:Fe-S cluster assembly protein SufD [Cardiobacteriaceae bacterium]